MWTLAELDPQDRPRERLLAEGAARLAPEELVALVLGTGRGSGEDALQLARRLLREIGGVSGLAVVDLDVLCAVQGIGPVKAARLLAARELARRASVPAAPRQDGGSSGPNSEATVGSRALPGGGPGGLLVAPGSVDGQKEAESDPDTAPVRPQAPPPGSHATESAPSDPVEQDAMRLRGEVAAGERAILGVPGSGSREPVTLALGEGLGPHTRPGTLLMRLVESGEGPWAVFVLRPGGPPTPRERDAAERMVAAAELLSVRLERVVLLAGRRHWVLSESLA